MGETYRHCQCDNCSGEDCGQDNPDKLKAEQEAAQKEHDDGIRKEERERINNELDYIKHTESLQEFFVTVRLCDVRKIVRGEP